MRYILLILLLAACDPIVTSGSYSDGVARPVYLWQQPLCLFGCSNTLQTTGSVVGVVGDGSPSTSLSPSSSSSNVGGATN